MAPNSRKLKDASWDALPISAKALRWYYYDTAVARALMQALAARRKKLDVSKASTHNSPAL